MKIMIWLLCLSLLLAACNLPGGSSPESIAIRIVEPVDDTQLEVGQLIDVHSMVSYPGGEFSISLLVNDDIDRTSIIAHPMVVSDVYEPWMPEEPGEYLLQSEIKSQGQSAVSNSVRVIVLDPIAKDAPDKETSSLTPSTTPILTTGTWTPTFTQVSPTPTLPTETPTPGNPQAMGTQNTNCRHGPAVVYDIEGLLMEGETAPIVGRNADNSWWVIVLPDTQLQCWVWGGGVRISGNTGSVPVIAAPPTPTFTPEAPSTIGPTYSACHDYPDLSTCSSDPEGFGGCFWDTGTNKCRP